VFSARRVAERPGRSSGSIKSSNFQVPAATNARVVLGLMGICECESPRSPHRGAGFLHRAGVVEFSRLVQSEIYREI
jgi:hypothetical protein